MIPKTTKDNNFKSSEELCPLINSDCVNTKCAFYFNGDCGIVDSITQIHYISELLGWKLRSTSKSRKT